MAEYTQNLAEDKFYWCSKLLILMQEMAAQHTNAVLKVLANVDHLQAERRYPEAGLLFAEKQWRVFYHCHEVTVMHPDEHGHFHLFTDIGNEDWAHVAGLSIDTEGQPLQWFMTNRWVTDGSWLRRENLVEQLNALVPGVDDDLVGNWLTALLQLYSDTLFDLLEKRDAQIQKKLKGRNMTVTLDDRDVYLLASQSIDLQFMLKKYLLRNQANITQPTINVETVQTEI